MASSSVLAKDPSFVSTPANVNWHHLLKDFDKFANQLGYEFKKESSQHQVVNSESYLIQHQSCNNNETPHHHESKKFVSLYPSNETNNKGLEMFIQPRKY